MDPFMILLRVIHITSGVFWAGTIFFLVLFLTPSIKASGPDGARVMQALQRRHFLNVMPVVAGLTILSGVMLFGRVFAGAGSDAMKSGFGLSLTIGTVASLFAFVVGVFGVRAATVRAGRLGAALAAASDGGERETMQAELDRSRLRAASSARWVAGLLAIAVLTMAVARYV